MQDYIKKHKFLSSLFPNGISEDNVLISDVCMKMSGNAVLSIHTLDEPYTLIPKWGKWGVNYNVIVIELLFSGVDCLKIKNWEDLGWGSIKIKKLDNKKNIFYNSKGMEMEINFDDLLFQKCDQYLILYQ